MEGGTTGGPLFDDGLDAIILYDPQGRVLRANAAAESMLDHPQGRFPARFETHVAASERANAASHFSRARSGARRRVRNDLRAFRRPRNPRARDAAAGR